MAEAKLKSVSILTALIDILQADSDVTDLTTTSRIFGFEVPKSEADSMPRSACVLDPVPAGAVMNDYLPLSVYAVDIFNYGARAQDAEQLQRATHDALERVNRDIFSGIMVHSVLQDVTPNFGRDRDADWPFMLEGWVAQYASVTVS